MIRDTFNEFNFAEIDLLVVEKWGTLYARQNSRLARISGYDLKCYRGGR
jgi:hypothetical protein